MARQPVKDLAPPESPEYLKACLQLPEHLDPIVEETAKKVLVGPKDVWKQSLACQIWFQNNFEYGFGYDFAGAKDPIADFLRKKPPAHCELFAASMTLMLRTQGIPTRYVNGFVCVERSWGSDYYVVEPAGQLRKQSCEMFYAWLYDRMRRDAAMTNNEHLLVETHSQST